MPRQWIRCGMRSCTRKKHARVLTSAFTEDAQKVFTAPHLDLCKRHYTAAKLYGDPTFVKCLRMPKRKPGPPFRERSKG